MAGGGPALLFTNPSGFSMPVASNIFGSMERMCLALGVKTLDDLASEIDELMTPQMPAGIMDALKMLPMVSRLKDLMPKGMVIGVAINQRQSVASASEAAQLPYVKGRPPRERTHAEGDRGRWYTRAPVTESGEHCRLCGSRAVEGLLGLGEHPIAHRFLKTPAEPEYRHPVDLGLCARTLVVCQPVEDRLLHDRDDDLQLVDVVAEPRPQLLLRLLDGRDDEHLATHDLKYPRPEAGRHPHRSPSSARQVRSPSRQWGNTGAPGRSLRSTE